MKIGERVGVIQGKNDNGTINVYGYGVYDGEHKLPKEAGGFNFGQVNPRMKLDSGKYVFGCESWWGPEEKVKQMLAGKNIIFTDIDEERMKK